MLDANSWRIAHMQYAIQGRCINTGATFAASWQVLWKIYKIARRHRSLTVVDYATTRYQSMANITHAHTCAEGNKLFARRSFSSKYRDIDVCHGRQLAKIFAGFPVALRDLARSYASLHVLAQHDANSLGSAWFRVIFRSTHDVRLGTFRVVLFRKAY